MNDTNLTDEELVRAVDNDPAATPRERELARRLYEAMLEIRVLEEAGRDEPGVDWNG